MIADTTHSCLAQDLPDGRQRDHQSAENQEIRNAGMPFAQQPQVPPDVASKVQRLLSEAVKRPGGQSGP